MSKTIELKGRVFISFDVKAVTGLHIGGSDTGIEIGGVDKTVIRDRLTNRPYIPGSSLKGKMRSLTEKYRNRPQNQRIGQGYIHSCDTDTSYNTCDVCQVFGVPGERDFGTPTRIVVRDVQMTGVSVAELEKARTDLPYTEVKTEVSIDRVTSAANPRQMERVPAGAEFVYTVYSGDGCDPSKDIERLAVVVEGLQLVEDDYLGGRGSRGSGKVEFQKIKVEIRANGSYLQPRTELGEYPTLADLVNALPDLQQQVRQQLGLS